MEHLSPAQIAELRTALVAERDRLLTTVDDEEQTAATDDDRGDMEDRAAREHGRTNARLRQRHHTLRLDEVKAALVRIDAGLYGVCEETGENIPFGRLRLEPTTRYTVAALELLEDERARARVRAADDSDGVY